MDRREAYGWVTEVKLVSRRGPTERGLREVTHVFCPEPRNPRTASASRGTPPKAEVGHYSRIFHVISHLKTLVTDY